MCILTSAVSILTLCPFSVPVCREDLVDADDQSKVRDVLKTRELRSLQRRLAGDAARLDREESVSRMSSFRTSREGVDGQPPTTGGSQGSEAVSTFPKFYSTRHNKLLPPKGACFDIEPKRLVQMFHTDIKTGLRKDEIEERQKMYGKNILPVNNTNMV
jgi:hypothetical protein